MAEPLKIELSIPAASEFIAVVRLAISGVATRMNFSIEEIEDIKISISEACTNAIQHAYEDTGKKGIIKINCWIHPDSLEVEVSDTGKGFDTKKIVSKKNLDQENSPFGLGLGLTFIKSLMSDLEIHSEIGKGTTIRMIKRVPETETVPTK